MSERSLNPIEIVALAVTVLLLVLFLTGCTTIEYGTFRYVSPPWERRFDRLEVLKDENGDLLVTIENYENKGAAPIVESAVRAAIEAAK